MRTLCIAAVLLVATSAAAGRPPNIVYILADDLGWADVGCYGSDHLKTPRVDQLAAEGMRFTDHYSGSCVCAPTRSSLLQGLHTGHARVRANNSYLRKKNGNAHLAPDDVTIGEVLQPAGYTTGVIGKWGVGEAGSTGVPNKQGFDFWFGYLNQSNAHHYYPPFLWKNDAKVLYPDNPTARTDYSHDHFTEEGLAFIERNKDQPFFLYMAYTIPHVDLDVPDDSKQPFVGVIPETKPYGTPGGQHYRHEKQPHATFAGMVSRLDRDVGRIVDRLDELGLGDNTLVIFTSDNGPTPAGGADPNFFDGNGPLRGIKFSLYEGGIRVPMIARWPGRVAEGTTSNHISAHWDMLPTFAQLAEVDTPPNDGISMCSTLLDDGYQPKHDMLYWEYYQRGIARAARMGNWKAIQNGVVGNKASAMELYDLSVDPGESDDVAAANPSVIAEFKAKMQAVHTPTDDYALKPLKRN